VTNQELQLKVKKIILIRLDQVSFRAQTWHMYSSKALVSGQHYPRYSVHTTIIG
jgi:hypothetical protein